MAILDKPFDPFDIPKDQRTPRTVDEAPEAWKQYFGHSHAKSAGETGEADTAAPIAEPSTSTEPPAPTATQEPEPEPKPDAMADYYSQLNADPTPAATPEESAPRAGGVSPAVENPTNQPPQEETPAEPAFRTTEKDGQEPPRVILSAAEFCAHRKDVQWLIKGHVQKNALMMIFGKSGAYKSFLALDQALTVAAGLPDWHGSRVTQGKVLYLTGEGETGFQKRIAAWSQDRGIPLVDLPFYVGTFTLDMNTNEGGLIKAVKAAGITPDWILFDTLIHYLNGDENKAQDARDLIIGCNAVKNYFGCSVTLIHHTGVSEEAQHRARGSSAFIGAMDIQTEVEAPPVEGDRRRVVMNQRKNKDYELCKEMTFAPRVVDLDMWRDEDNEVVKSIVLDPETAAQAQRAQAVPEKFQKLVASYRKACEAGLGTISEQTEEFKGLAHSKWQSFYTNSENGFTKQSTEKSARQEFNAGINALLENMNLEILNPNDARSQWRYVLSGKYEKERFPEYATAAHNAAAKKESNPSDAGDDESTDTGRESKSTPPQKKRKRGALNPYAGGKK